MLGLFFIYLSMWLILTGGRVDFFAIFFILLFAILTPSIFKIQRGRISFLGAMELTLFFMKNSIKGGFMVSKLALKPHLNLQPSLYEVNLKTKTSFASCMLANIYSLMPGTATIEVNEEKLVLHVIDKSLFDIDLIDKTQQKVIKAFESEAQK